jgi:hypothetical protein
MRGEVFVPLNKVGFIPTEVEDVGASFDLYTTIDGPTKERGGPGEHYCEGFILKRLSDAAGARAPVSEPMPEPSDFQRLALAFAIRINGGRGPSGRICSCLGVMVNWPERLLG